MRKYFFSVLILLLCCDISNAQNCRNYLLLQNNKRVEMTIYNRKGKEDGKQIWQVSNVKSTGKSTTATISSEFFDKKGKSINKGENEIKCTGGAFFMNLKMMLSEQQLGQMKNAKATANGDLMEYPVSVKEGDRLKDASLTINIQQEGGLNSSVEINVTNRAAGGKETITSPAGTWECIKITSDQKITSRIAGIAIPMKMELTEWLAPGVGVIKTSSKYGSTLITSIQ